MFIPRFFQHILLILSLASHLLIASQSPEHAAKRKRLDSSTATATSPQEDQPKQRKRLDPSTATATARRASQPKQSPLHALSVNLLQTYKEINKREKAAKTSLQDLQAGMFLQERYKLQKLLGKGVSSQVWLARDLKEPKHVAIKIFSPSWSVRSIKKEFDCLVKLQSLHTPHTPRLLARFQLKDDTTSRHCLVFNYLAHNLYTLIKKTNHQGISLRLTQHFATQLLKTLISLKKAKIVHTDIKPENIMLCSPTRADILLIDFGSAEQSPSEYAKSFYEDSVVQSRYYRSPEALLEQARLTCKADLWSLGAVLFELYDGEPLFRRNELKPCLCKNTSELALNMIRVLGKMPETLELPEELQERITSQEASGELKPGSVSLESLVNQAKSRKDATRVETDEHKTQFIDFLHQLLHYDAEQRPSPEHLLQHPFITTSH